MARRSILATTLVLVLSAPTAAAAYRFAPYLDFTAYPTPDLATIRQASGTREITLAFVTAAADRRCAPAWGGDATQPADGPDAYRRASILAANRDGNRAIISFGGEAGVELATACRTVPALQAAYASVVAAYRAHRIDFDVEGAAIADPTSIARRSAALAALQHADPGLQISLTLPVLPTGLTPQSARVVRSALRTGLRIATVNGMTMDFGDSAAPHPAGQMARYAIRAAQHMRAQLARFYPHRSARARMAMIGLTPMIGQNDTTDEIFTLTDAATLASFARSSGIGTVSMWALGRDGQCSRPERYADSTCSGVTQTPWQFSRTLGRQAVPASTRS